MHKKVGVLFVHGMGAVTDDFAHDAIQELRERGIPIKSERLKLPSRKSCNQYSL